jgi:peptidoglycan-associated lipoprotein
MSLNLTFRATLAIAALVLSACSSTKLAETNEVKGKPVEVAAAPPPAGPAAVAPRSAVVAVIADHLNPNSLISKERSVYFDYDKFDIKSESTALVERQGKYLAANPGLALRVEGNADERGGREYNLALGQKRADAVARALKVYGASDKQLEAVSYGKEKPQALGHDEAAWAQNRRADLAYPNK